MSNLSYALDIAPGAMCDRPELDVNNLINYAFDLCSKGNNATKNDLQKAAEEIRKRVVVCAKHKMKEKAAEIIQKLLSDMGLDELSDEEFAFALIEFSQFIAVWIRQYLKKEISRRALVDNLTGPGTTYIMQRLLAATGVYEIAGIQNLEGFLNLSYPVMAYTASMVVYKELRRIREEYEQAHEERILIEKACEESISMIRRYREKMNREEAVCLVRYQETFDAAIANMERALMDDDVDGYIKGNVEVQRILGADIQFTNQKEFDELMASDIPFRL